MYFQWEEEEEEHRQSEPCHKSVQTGPNFFFFISSFFTQSMDGPGSFKPVAS
jgi:hypothetical protein